MLVLSRKKNESIQIADGLISIVVVEVRGDKVRLGIEAPASISVHRSEVLDAIHRGESHEEKEKRKQAAMAAIAGIMEKAG